MQLPDHNKAKLYRKAFVAEYIKNGMNGTRAMLAVKPHLTQKSAGVIACRELNDVKVQEEIIDYYTEAKDEYFSLLKHMLHKAREWAETGSEKDRERAAKFVADIGKTFAIAQQGPRKLVQNLKYTLPKG